MRPRREPRFDAAARSLRRGLAGLALALYGSVAYAVPLTPLPDAVPVRPDLDRLHARQPQSLDPVHRLEPLRRRGRRRRRVGRRASSPSRATPPAPAATATTWSSTTGTASPRSTPTWTRSPSPSASTSTREPCIGTVGQHRQLARRPPALRGAHRASPSIAASFGGVPYFYGSLDLGQLRRRPDRRRLHGRRHRRGRGLPPWQEVVRSSSTTRGRARADVRERRPTSRSSATGTATAGSTSASGAAKGAKFRLQTPTGIAQARLRARLRPRVAGRLGRQRDRPRSASTAPPSGTFYQRLPTTARRPSVLLGDCRRPARRRRLERQRGHRPRGLRPGDRDLRAAARRRQRPGVDRHSPARRARRPAGHGRLGRRRHHRPRRLDPRHGDLRPGQALFSMTQLPDRGRLTISGRPRPSSACRAAEGRAGRSGGGGPADEVRRAVLRVASARTCARRRRAVRRRRPCPAGTPAS